MWQSAQVIPPQLLEIIIDRSGGMIDQSSFSWNMVGGFLVGFALIGAGAFVAIVTGGAGTPALLASISTATGLSGVMYTTTTAIKGETFEWTAFATESLVGGATAALTVGAAGVCKAVTGVAKIADLSRTAFAAAAATASVGVKVARNAVEGNDLLDGVLATAIGAMACGLIGAPSGSNFLPTNTEIIQDIGLSIAHGAVAGALSGTAAQAVSNLIAGHNVFENIGDAIKYGALNGAIGASAHTVQVTAGRLVERRYHEVQIQHLRADVASGAPTGSVPLTLLFTPGDGSNPGHYVRLRNSTLKPVSTAITGPSTCLADALGVSPESLATAYTLETMRAALRSLPADARADLPNQDIGGGGGHMNKRDFKAKNNAKAQRFDFHRDLKPEILKMLNAHPEGHKFYTRNENPDIYPKIINDILQVRFKATKGGEHWAVIVVGSRGYENYRHQADACHAYHVVRRHGIPEENVILMMYDDAADAPENPFKGKLFNKPSSNATHGSGAMEVYEGCKVDYRGEDVTPEMFLAVLRGDKTVTKGNKVLESGPDDRVFVNFVDHGARGVLIFPHGKLLTAKQLTSTLEKMHAAKQYKELVFYVEACHSGSMFWSWSMSRINAFVTTAANGWESSWGTYCPPQDIVNGVTMNTCLGDLYSINWMEDSDRTDLSGETLSQQYQLVKKETHMSHVEAFGSTTVRREIVGNFQSNYDNAPVDSTPALHRPTVTKINDAAASSECIEQTFHLFGAVFGGILHSDSDIGHGLSSYSLQHTTVFSELCASFGGKLEDIRAVLQAAHVAHVEGLKTAVY
ncbi:hypothetical protein P43SY_003663 [Pythium insidiosum]|uniref:legumain n=1 Tax=Pythium insidiosum TaxID=114742 RepID=A0AAD5Q8H2_PYTIN|nr:hypothetical protein P43SY_003663 [Pythium insidiosum]